MQQFQTSLVLLIGLYRDGAIARSEVELRYCFSVEGDSFAQGGHMATSVKFMVVTQW